jgi:hypothetical protein
MYERGCHHALGYNRRCFLEGQRYGSDAIDDAETLTNIHHARRPIGGRHDNADHVPRTGGLKVCQQTAASPHAGPANAREWDFRVVNQGLRMHRGSKRVLAPSLSCKRIQNSPCSRIHQRCLQGVCTRQQVQHIIVAIDLHWCIPEAHRRACSERAWTARTGTLHAQASNARSQVFKQVEQRDENCVRASSWPGARKKARRCMFCSERVWPAESTSLISAAPRGSGRVGAHHQSSLHHRQRHLSLSEMMHCHQSVNYFSGPDFSIFTQPALSGRPSISCWPPSGWLLGRVHTHHAGKHC